FVDTIAVEITDNNTVHRVHAIEQPVALEVKNQSQAFGGLAGACNERPSEPCKQQTSLGLRFDECDWLCRSRLFRRLDHDCKTFVGISWIGRGGRGTPRSIHLVR